MKVHIVHYIDVDRSSTSPLSSKIAGAFTDMGLAEEMAASAGAYSWPHTPDITTVDLELSASTGVEDCARRNARPMTDQEAEAIARGFKIK